MKISLETLSLLKGLGDVRAATAWAEWIRVAPFKEPAAQTSAHWLSDGSFGVGLVWDTRVAFIRRID